MNTELKEILLNTSKPSTYFEHLEESETFHELFQTKGVIQSPIHHPEGDVWTHTMMVLDQGATLKNQTSNPLGFMLTCLFHDLGKTKTTTVEEDGRIRSIGHENQLDLVKQACLRITDDIDLIAYVLNMTKYHMRLNALYFQHSSQKAFNKVFKVSINPKDLILFSKADHLGRKGFTTYEEVEKVLYENLEQYKKMR